MEPKCYDVCQVAGKGLGLVAKRQISAGEKILEEAPTIYGDSHLCHISYVRHLFEQLSDRDHERVLKLANAFPEDQEMGILRTNTYGLGVEGDLFGLFLELSRVNHSCRPNSERCWDAEREVETLYALCDIGPGEELTVSYIQVAEMTREERQVELRTRWRFDCACECCADHESQESDMRRMFVHRFHVIVSQFRAPSMYQAAKKALLFLDLEGLHGSPKASVCLIGHELALMMRNQEEAKVWVQKRHSEFLLATGPDSSWTKDALDMMTIN
jgi:hypothetical protein